MQCNYSNVLTNVHDFITSQSVIGAKHGLVLSGGCLQADYKHVETVENTVDINHVLAITPCCSICV